MEIEIENEKQHLIDYILTQTQAGTTQDELRKQLAAVGWTEEDIESAYAIGLEKYGVPVPRGNAEKTSGRKIATVEIVINFFSFILLGISVTSLGVLLYGVIGYFFPDKLMGYYSYAPSESIHYAIAAIVISFPLYYFTMRFWFRRFDEDKGRTEARLTKWITYLVLLISAVTIVGDMIVIIFNMLQGEITARFFLKALTILMIAGGVFGFYFLERKKIQYKKDIPRKTFRIFGWVVIGVISASIILGFLASGSPKTQRMRSFDNNRANDLQSLASCLNDFANKNKALPESLEALREDSAYNYCSNKKDPETNIPYEYRVINKSFKVGQVTKGEFELCANFSLASINGNKGNYEYYNDNSKWAEHTAGINCDKESIVIIEKNNESVKNLN